MDGNRSYPYRVDSFSNEAQDTANRISTEQLQHLVHLLDDSDVSEIEVKRAEEGMHLVLRKAKFQSGDAASEYQLPTRASDEEAVVPVETRHTVVAPLVGIFHNWARPKGKDLVAIGDHVKVGQSLGSIQSLNVFNEVESTIAGRVVEFLVQDGAAVEYGQPLLVIDGAEGA